jgi:CDP-glucose 4,6-dehydratase
LSYYHTYKLPVAVTRCGNLYGGGDLNFNRLIPGTIRSVVAGEPPLIRSDGSFVRDYFYVRDAVAAYLDLASQMPDPRLNGQAFNFGTGTPMSVVDIVRLVLRLMDRSSFEPVILNQASGEIPRQYLDYRKATKVLGWRPAYSVEAGLRETINWYEAFFESGSRVKQFASAVG